MRLGDILMTPAPAHPAYRLGFPIHGILISEILESVTDTADDRRLKNLLG